MAGTFNQFQAMFGAIVGNVLDQLNLKTYLVTQVTATITANGTIAIPAGYMIESIVLKSNNANAITGGLNIGTTDGGAEVLAAQAVAGNSIFKVAPADLLKSVFSTTVDQVLYIQAETEWNSASLTYYVNLIALVKVS